MYMTLFSQAKDIATVQNVQITLQNKNEAKAYQSVLVYVPMAVKEK